MGQVIIYWSVRSNRITITDATQKSKDQTIARRLLTVAMSDFLCWFPIGVLGLLASTGTAVPGELNVAMAILVLPLNSALNPFMYTLSTAREKWRRLKQERKARKVIGRIQTEIDRWPVDRVETLVRHCLRHKLAERAEALLAHRVRDKVDEHDVT